MKPVKKMSDTPNAGHFKSGEQNPMFGKSKPRPEGAGRPAPLRK